MRTHKYTLEDSLELEAFKQMDYKAVEELDLDIELMMENAGLNLAKLVALKASKKDTILIGCGNGNNGGGGLVAARRLLGWGFKVYLNLPVEIDKALPLKQLNRALKFGAKTEIPNQVDLLVDAYLGFSQKLPLSKEFLKAVEFANNSGAFLIALDLPTGISKNNESLSFKANQILTLAAPKKILFFLDEKVDIFVADLGIPRTYYQNFGINMPEFEEQTFIQLQR